MTLLVIADDELVLRILTDTQAEVLVSCGDLTEETIMLAARICGARHILAVKGNHDSNAAFKAPIVDLHLTVYSIRGITFGGFCGAWKYKPKGHHLFEQSEVERALAGFQRVDVFVAHNSPRIIHDRDDEIHFGFSAFNTYISQANPRCFLHGHQHLNVETTVGVTRVIGTYGYRTLVIPG